MLFLIFLIIIAIIAFNLFKGSKKVNSAQTFDTSPIIPPKATQTSSIKYVDNSKVLPNYTVIDVETTGFDYRHDKIIQLAALRIRNHQSVDSLYFVVNPGIPIPEEASKINGFTDDMVKDKEEFIEHISELMKFLGNDVLLAHNADFDRQFIEYQIGESLPNNWIDTLSFSRQAVYNMKNYKLVTLYKDLCHKDPINAHDALADCKMTHEVFETIINKLGTEGKSISLNNNQTQIKWYAYEIPKKEFRKNDTAKPEYPFYKKHIVFSGRIPGMTRRQAIQAVFDQGGDYGNQLRQKTSILVKGEEADESIINQAKTGLLPDKPIRIITAEEFKQLVSAV